MPAFAAPNLIDNLLLVVPVRGLPPSIGKRGTPKGFVGSGFVVFWVFSNGTGSSNIYDDFSSYFV